jgi:hypothetical protein
MKRENLNSRSFQDSIFFLKNRASAMRYLIAILITRDLRRDEMRVARIEINLMIFDKNLLTIDEIIKKFSRDLVFFLINEIFQ